MRLCSLAIRLVGLALGAAVSLGAASSTSDWKLSQFGRRVWQVEDGLPHNYVAAIATDDKGYLLLGTSAGIARFDGSHFTPFEHFGGTRIYALMRGSDGALWAGTAGGLSVVRNGKVEASYGSGAYADIVHSLLEDRSHRIWAVSAKGLLRVEGGRLRMIAPGSNADGFKGEPIAEDDDGSIWFASQEGLFRISRGVEGHAEITAMQLSGAGGKPVSVYYSTAFHQLYLGATTGLYRLKCFTATCESTPVPEVKGPVSEIRVSSDGALWIATWGNGIYREDGSRIEQLSTREGLADDFVRVLSEDREHNLWAGTRSGGLTRFRKTALKPFGIPEGLGGNYASAVLGDGADGLWLGTWRSGLFHWRNGVMTPQPLPRQPLGLLISSMGMDAHHDLWIGSLQGLWKIRNGTSGAARVPLANDKISNLLISRDRALWLASDRLGLRDFPSGSPETSSPVRFLDGETVTALLEDTAGRIWVGAKGGLWRVSAGPRRELERLSQSSITALAQDSHGRVWVAAEDGNIQVHTAKGPTQFRYSGLPSPAVYTIATNAPGGFWFGTGRGLARASAPDVEAFLDGRQARVDLVNYGVSEGMRTVECRVGAQPSNWKLPDGSVWLPTARGFVAIDPAHKEFLDPPRPLVETVRVDGNAIAPGVPIRLKPGAHDLALAFTAIRLGRAESVQFRYRMQGLDDDWVEAGSERIVRYGHLRPGQFQLLVSARDPGGAWSEPASTAAIVQVPFVYQTVWFRSALAGLVLLLTVLLYRFRLHAVRRRYAAALEERNRIAREWHDTLLAGLAAASWQLDVAAERCGQTTALSSVQSARGMVRYCSDEARRAVSELRDEPHCDVSLADRLRQSIDQLTGGTALRLRFEMKGKLPPCSSELSSDLLRICQEATANALRHAFASELVVRVVCGDESISLSVEDDGVGMDASAIEHPPHGHYGLLGMRERAQRSGGNLYLSSQPGHGTTVRAVVPIGR